MTDSSDSTTRDTAAQRVWVALHEEREFVGVFSTRDAAVQWANTRAGTWPNGKPRDYVYEVFETTVDAPEANT